MNILEMYIPALPFFLFLFLFLRRSGEIIFLSADYPDNESCWKVTTRAASRLQPAVIETLQRLITCHCNACFFVFFQIYCDKRWQRGVFCSQLPRGSSRRWALTLKDPGRGSQRRGLLFKVSETLTLFKETTPIFRASSLTAAKTMSVMFALLHPHIHVDSSWCLATFMCILMG